MSCIEPISRQATGIMTNLCNAKSSGDNGIVPSTTHGHSRVSAVLRLRVHNRPEFVERINELANFHILGKDPAPSEVGIGPLLGGEAAGRLLGADRADRMDGRGLLADMEPLLGLATE